MRDARTQRPLGFASVFLANTTYGTTTDSTGHFALAGIQPGQYELVASYLGYQLATQPLALTQGTTTTLALQPNAVQLDEVTVRPTKNNAADFRRFVRQFLGSSTWSQQCRIENPEAVVVLYDRKSQVLRAVAPRGLRVRNPVLGYRITFHQFQFKVDYRAGRVEFAAAPAYEELPGAERQLQWQQNRRRAYAGSLQHFLRSLRENRLAQEGFVARRLVQELDSEPLRQRLALAADSLLQVLAPAPGIVARVYKQPLVAAQLCRTEAATGRVWLQFPGSVQVTYQGEQPDASYLAAVAVAASGYRLEAGTSHTRPLLGATLTKNVTYTAQPEVSELQLLAPQALILPTGYLRDPLSIKVEGYWAFEKVGEALPLDYQAERVR